MVRVIMGSDSDWETMTAAADVLTRLAVPVRATVASAHQTEERIRPLMEEPNIRVIIAGPGAAAHLAECAVVHTVAPVIGVGGAANAGWPAGEMLAVGDETRRVRLLAARAPQAETALATVARVEAYRS
jgi:phosphoribosylcarboxyaminoimidazole (NCAIR) mutase